MEKALIEMDAPPGFEMQEGGPRFLLQQAQIEMIEARHAYKLYLSNLEEGNPATKIRLLKSKTDLVVYRPRLATLLLDFDLQIENRHSRKLEKFPKEEFLKTYKKAFLKGRDYFNKEFRSNKSDLYGPRGKELIERINRFSFEVKIKGKNAKGWAFVTSHDIIFVDHLGVYTHGFYSGVFSEALSLAADHKELFLKFELDKGKGGNEYPKLFKPGGVDKYHYLFGELDLQDKTKVSTLWHFFKRQNLFSAATQKEYLQFVAKEYDVIPSKIFPINYNMEDYINSVLPRLLDQYKKS